MAEPTATIYLRVSPELRKKLDELAAQTGKSLNDMGIEALERYVKEEKDGQLGTRKRS